MNCMTIDPSAVLGRAATFRGEAEALRQRACASGESVIRDQYLMLADRWSMLAASLEGAFFAKDQTTLL